MAAKHKASRQGWKGVYLKFTPQSPTCEPYTPYWKAGENEHFAEQDSSTLVPAFNIGRTEHSIWAELIFIRKKAVGRRILDYINTTTYALSMTCLKL